MKTIKQFVGKLQLLPALVLFLGLFSCVAAYAQITPLGDSYTDTADPTANYGAKTLLDVDGATQIAYVQFNLASIPTTASVSQAMLKLYVNSVTTPGSFNVDYVNGAWTEGTINASNAPALGSTIASGVAITTADKNQYILINVTSAVQAWLDGSEANDGIALVADGTFNATFDSKESTSTSHPAELDIAFAGGDGTITGVTTASGSGLAGGGTSGTLNLSLTSACATNQVLHWNGSAWTCASAGTGTITGITAGTDLTGGGTSGNVTLNLNTSALNSTYAQLGAANTFAPQQVIKGNGGNAVIGDPGCGSGFSGIGLTSSTLSGCSNYTMMGKSSGDVYVNSTSTGYIHFRNGNTGSNTYNDLATIDNAGNVTVAGNLTIAGQENLNYKELINANSNYQALDVTQFGGTGDGIDATTSSTTGYGVKGTSPNVGVLGSSSVGYGVEGSSTASSGVVAGVIGTAASNSGAGVMGIESSATGESATGVAGIANSSSGYGVTGTSANVGVYGLTTGTNPTNYGVEGFATWASDAFVSFGAGVYGNMAGSSTNGAGSAGVWGDTNAASSDEFGLYFFAVEGSADDSVAGYFVNNSAEYSTLKLVNKGTGGTGAKVLVAEGRSGICSMDTGGNANCTGKVGADAPAGDGSRRVSLYAVQSPENWFEDFGSGVLTNGAMTVPLDPTFASTVNSAIDYHVFLTPRGECEGLYVANLTPSGFEVRELHHGSSNVAFDYRIVAKRAGYENQRLEDVTERYQKMRERDEKLGQQTQRHHAAGAGSTRPVPPATRELAPIAPAGSAAGPIPLPSKPLSAVPHQAPPQS